MKSLTNSILLLFLLLSSLIAFAINEDKSSIYYSAKEYYKQNDFENAYIRFKQFIDSTEYTPLQDHGKLGDAYYNIGHFYKCGHYLACNIDSALYYLNVAAYAYKNAKAARMLHAIYYYTDYGLVDKDKSFIMLRMAADLGDIKSNLEVGDIFLSGSSSVLKDTTIYSFRHNRVNAKGDTIPSYSYTINITPTKSIIKFPDIPRDLTLGYYYYERGINVNRLLVNKKYTLTDIDFIRAYMDGTYREQDYEAAWQYLREYLDESRHFSATYDLNDNYGEIYWRIQAAYRFGLGIRSNILRADYYLNKSAEYGYEPAKNALNLLK